MPSMRGYRLVGKNRSKEKKKDAVPHEPILTRKFSCA